MLCLSAFPPLGRPELRTTLSFCHGGRLRVSSALIELVGRDILCSVLGGGAEVQFSLDEALPQLMEWSRRYEAASARDREGQGSRIKPL